MRIALFYEEGRTNMTIVVNTPTSVSADHNMIDLKWVIVLVAITMSWKVICAIWQVCTDVSEEPVVSNLPQIVLLLYLAFGGLSIL